MVCWFLETLKNAIRMDDTYQDSVGSKCRLNSYSDSYSQWFLVHPSRMFFCLILRENESLLTEMAILDGYIVIYKFIQDPHFFVTRGDDESELIIATVLHGFFDAVGLLLRYNVDKRSALENLDLILLCLDEIVDEGIILETEASIIAAKVTISQALAIAREHLARSHLK
ncbi:hypothetical protein MUK42_25461 [Musa troglodytarum]|uniref:Coatomer subunit zeta n=1 Tax=Musa troglodytarum TaxID=320322 RepID=A0A9E7I532_9LILI|nr:hypothetical protein MUK42_25461 [Musa troglodytarum]URE45674.1 hypothetical protein MUK42_25461 [Musa troglodytarum]